MAIINTVSAATTTALGPAKTSKFSSPLTRRDRMLLVSDVLPPCDFLAVLVAAYVSSVIFRLLTAPGALSETLVETTFAQAWMDRGNIALIGAALATYFLYDQNFASAAALRQTHMLVRSYLLRATATVAIVIAIGEATRLFDKLPNLWLTTWFAVSFVLTAGVRLIAARRVRVMEHRGALVERIAVVGAGPLAENFNRHLRERRASNIELLGIFDDMSQDPAAHLDSMWPVNSLEHLIELGKTRAIDWIVLAIPESEQERMQTLVERLQVIGVPIAHCPQNFDARSQCRTVEYAGNGMPVLLLADRPIKAWNVALKAAEDFVLGWTLLLMALPLLAAIAIAVRMSGPGPIIFKQRRHTFNNTEFDIYKFRTMRWQPASDGKLQQTQRNDARVTPIGRWLRALSLDELPQLFNVVKGEMSVIGPRPHAVNMRTEDRMGWEITDRYAHRHRVKPGMTGWAQVNGARGATDTAAQLQRRVELDLYYIDNWSLWLDVKILFLTWRAVISRTNAF